MAKKQKPHAKNSFRKLLFWSFSVLAAVMFGLQTAAIVHLYKQVGRLDSATIERLIIQSVDGLSQPMPVEAQSGQRYIPAARLVFPAASLKDSLPVDYIAYQEDGKDPVIQLNSRYTMSAVKSRMMSSQGLEEKFTVVPKLQACSRQVVITFDARAEHVAKDPVKIAEKKLGDGRTAYIFEDRACGKDANRLIEFAQQVESY